MGVSRGLAFCRNRVQTLREQGLSIASSSLLTIPSEKMKTNSLAVDGSETVGLVTEDLGYFLLDKVFGWC